MGTNRLRGTIVVCVRVLLLDVRSYALGKCARLCVRARQRILLLWGLCKWHRVIVANLICVAPLLGTNLHSAWGLDPRIRGVGCPRCSTLYSLGGDFSVCSR
jgi:hypothetical protein